MVKFQVFFKLKNQENKAHNKNRHFVFSFLVWSLQSNVAINNVCDIFLFYSYQEVGFKSSNLFCRFAHYDNPRLFIRPAKEEVLFYQPRITVFHDILTDKEMATLINISKSSVSVYVKEA